MGTSGTNSFIVTRDDIINASLRTLGVIGLGETASTDDITNCSQALNIMIKSWAKKGWPLWTVELLSINMVTGAYVYPIGPTAGYIYSVTITNGGTGYPNSGSIIFTGGGGTGATATYTASGGVIQTITVTAGGNSYTQAGPTVSAATGSGLVATANVVGLTTLKPVRDFTAFLRYTQTQKDITLLDISQEEYDMLGIKTTTGVPNQFYYANNLDTPLLYVYPVPAQSGYVLYLRTQYMFEDMTTGTDDFYFPTEAYQALKWGLSAEIAAEYGVPIEVLPYYEQKAQTYIDEVFNFSVEEASVYFEVDSQMYGNK